MGSGTILREVIKAQELLENDFSVTADIWSVTSFNELRRDALEVQRDNRMHPERKPKLCYVSQQLQGVKGPIIAATDYMRLYADQISQYVENRFVSLGTDGYGRSDTRKQLRHFFEVDAKHIVLASLNSLVREGSIEKDIISAAIKDLGINPDKKDPVNS